MKYVSAETRQWKQASGYQKALLVNAETFQVPGTILQTLRVAPKQKIAAHYHEHATEAFYILSGVGNMTIAGESVVLHPGDSLVIEAGEMHDAENPGNEEWTYIVFKTNWVDGDSIWQ